MNKILLTILLSFAWLASPQASGQVPVPNGSGTADDPFRIEQFHHLIWIANSVNHGEELSGMYFIQTADLDYNDVAEQFGDEGWDPIGGYRSVDGILRKVGFAGSYDGQGHTISNLSINRPAENYQALFGYTKGVIKNLKIDRASVTGNEYTAALAAYMFDTNIDNCEVSNSTAISSAFYVAALCGYQAWGTISNCSVTQSNVEGVDYVGGITGWNNEGNITLCHTEGSVKSSNSLAGGVAGYQYYGAMSKSYSNATVSGETYVGGLIGQTSHSSVTACFATGDVDGESYVGGFVGKNESTGITDSFATGNATAAEFVGGFAGYNTYSDGTMTGCYSTGKVTGDSYFTGGFIGGITGGTISSCYWNKETAGVSEGIGGVPQEGMTCYGKTTTEMKTATTYEGWDFETVWTLTPSNNDGYPQHRWYEGDASVNSVTKDKPQTTVMLSEDAITISADKAFCHIDCFDLNGRLVVSARTSAETVRLPAKLQKGNIYLISITYPDYHETIKGFCR